MSVEAAGGGKPALVAKGHQKSKQTGTSKKN